MAKNKAPIIAEEPELDLNALYGFILKHCDMQRQLTDTAVLSMIRSFFEQTPIFGSEPLTAEEIAKYKVYRNRLEGADYIRKEQIANLSFTWILQ